MLTFLYLAVCYFSNYISVDYKILAVTAIIDIIIVICESCFKKSKEE